MICLAINYSILGFFGFVFLVAFLLSLLCVRPKWRARIWASMAIMSVLITVFVWLMCRDTPVVDSGDNNAEKPTAAVVAVVEPISEIH